MNRKSRGRKDDTFNYDYKKKTPYEKIECIEDSIDALHNQKINIVIDEIIVPMLKRYNWMMIWQMGGVGFIRNSDYTEVINKTTRELDEYCETHCGSLWKVCLRINNDQFFGKENFDCLNPNSKAKRFNKDG